MAHPAEKWLSGKRPSRFQPGAVDPDVRGKQRVDRIKQPSKVDASTWSPPVSREISPAPVNLDGNLKLDKREVKEPNRY